MQRIPVIGTLLLLGSSIAFGQRVEQVPQKIDRSLSDGRIRTLNMDKQPLTPQKLWELGRVSGEGLSKDGKQLIYGIAYYDFASNGTEKNLYSVPVAGGEVIQLTTEKGGETVIDVTEDVIIYLFKGDLWTMGLNGENPTQLSQTEGKLANVRISPDGKHILYSKEVLVKNIHSKDKYTDLPESDAYVYDDLDYRHWDSFNDGRYNHPFVATYDNGTIGEGVDLLEGKSYYSPQAPFGGREDYIWTPDSKAILFVTKKKSGKDYAISTNTDIYRYDLVSGEITNLTEGMEGYDTHPDFSPNGERLAWLSMKTDGYEADKNDIVLLDPGRPDVKRNLTAHMDLTINSFVWSKDGRKIYFTAPVKGTVQLFEVAVPPNLMTRDLPVIAQISEGQFDVAGIVGEYDDGLVITSTKMTRATEVYRYSFQDKQLRPITTVNDEAYSQIAENKVEGRFTKASDGEELFSWIVYPPDFDPNKKYPTLLYCQGGPQSALTQTYSLRWNMQLIASQGYIVVAPNRRGMPGWGVKWNEDISGDWGGQPIRDYLSAIDDISKESYVDTDRLGAVGASYGGYSVFMLAGVHEGRFKSFISHCGLFDMVSWYGTTEELFFANKDVGGPYWDEANARSYNAYNPITHVEKWDTPILIIQGGKDYRVPIGQGLEAFQAAKLRGLKSRLLYLPDENHWVLSGHNAQVWQREFFKWLEETL